MVVHRIRVPSTVSPYAPCWEQNAPGCTPRMVAAGLGLRVVVFGAGAALRVGAFVAVFVDGGAVGRIDVTGVPAGDGPPLAPTGTGDSMLVLEGGAGDGPQPAASTATAAAANRVRGMVTGPGCRYRLLDNSANRLLELSTTRRR